MSKYLSDGWEGMLTFVGLMILGGFVAWADDKNQRVWRENEACAKAVCQGCEHGWPFVEGAPDMHVQPVEFNYNNWDKATYHAHCWSAAIRSRLMTPPRAPEA